MTLESTISTHYIFSLVFFLKTFKFGKKNTTDYLHKLVIMHATVIIGTIVHMGQMHACKKTKILENKIPARKVRKSANYQT